jgi:hypothetical protein
MGRIWEPLTWWVERCEAGNEWPIILTSDDLTPDIAGTDRGLRTLGITVRQKRTIYLWAGQSRKDLLDTTLHELMHLGMTYERRVTQAFEEKAVTVLTPNIMPILIRNGMHFPPLPDGWRSLQQHARWIRYGRDQWLANKQADAESDAEDD